MNTEHRTRNTGSSFSMSQGFTLIELVVSVAIFALITALVVAKYGNFNQSVLLTDLAYDVAITIRTAQAYGVSVKSASPNEFQHAYGVHFDTDTGIDQTTGNAKDKQLILFSDDNVSGTLGNYDALDSQVAVYAIKRGAFISNICIGTGPDDCGASASFVDISFKRPDPSAILCIDAADCDPDYRYAEITIQGVDQSTRVISVRQNGQISLKE